MYQPTSNGYPCHIFSLLSLSIVIVLSVTKGIQLVMSKWRSCPTRMPTRAYLRAKNLSRPPLSLSNSLDRTSLSAFTRSCSHAIMFLLRRNGDLFFCPSLTSLDFRLFFQPFILARHGKVWSQVCSSRFRSAALSISQRLLHFFDVNTPWQRRTNRWSEVCFYNRIVQSK